MAHDYEALMKALSGSGKKGMDLSKYSQLLSSAEGRAVLQQLASPGGAELKKAAEKASKGDTGAMRSVITSLLSTKEGAALAAQVMELSKK